LWGKPRHTAEVPSRIVCLSLPARPGILAARPRADAVPIRIFATDISDRAIEAARAGAYGESIPVSISFLER